MINYGDIQCSALYYGDLLIWQLQVASGEEDGLWHDDDLWQDDDSWIEE